MRGHCESGAGRRQQKWGKRRSRGVCGTRYLLRFTVRGMGGEPVTARLPCPGRRCGKHLQIQVPRNAERVRLEEAAVS